MFGTECRLKNAEDIVNEIEEVNKKHNPNFLWITILIIALMGYGKSVI